MTHDSEEWGPWIEHDGKGCPCVGKYVHARYARPVKNFHGGSSSILENDRCGFFAIAKGGDSWVFGSKRIPIIRYRIRKPRALRQLIEMVENLPAPSKQGERAK